jgi:hypothetical protein
MEDQVLEGRAVTAKRFLDVEDLEVCDLTNSWPHEEKYELGSQRRSSNSSPAQLAGKNDDRHIRNKIEGFSDQVLALTFLFPDT